MFIQGTSSFRSFSLQLYRIKMKLIVFSVIISCVAVAGLPQSRFQVLDGLSTWLSTLGASRPKFACQNGIFGPTLPIVFRTARCMLKELEGQDDLNVNCLYFCGAEIFDLLDPRTGLPSKDKYHQLVWSNFPEKLQPMVLDHFDSCLDKYGSLDLGDKKCTQAGMLHACTWSIIDDLVC